MNPRFCPDQKGVTPLVLLLIALAALVAYIFISGIFDFKNSVLKSLYPKPQSQASATSSVYWGAWINGNHYGTKTDGTTYKDAPYGLDTWDKFETNAGKKVSLLTFGMPFKSGTFAGNFPTSDMTTIRTRGAIPVL